MPPRGSRGGSARGGRGKGVSRAGPSGAERRTSVDDAVTQSTETPSQAQNSADGGDLAMQYAPMPSQATSVESRAPSVASSSRQSQTPSAVSSRAGGRFRPKNIRRDAAERARLEEERNRNLALKIKEEEREQRAEERRARRGRGRGDRSQRGVIRRTVTASGPFSAIANENVQASGSSWPWAPSSNPGFPRYQPRRKDEDRVNIDLLNGSTDHAEDGISLHQPSRYTQKSATGLPVGLLRMQHEDAELKVKTTAELEAEERQSSDDEELFVSQAKEMLDVAMNEDSEVWHAAPKSQVKVKAEPSADPESMDVDMADIPEAEANEPQSPQAKKRPIAGEDGAEAAQRKRKEKAAKDPEIMQTAYDLEAQLRELSLKTPADGEEDDGQDKDDIMYLFQLPPILPPLVKVADDINIEAGAANLTSQENTSGATTTKVKTEDGADKEKEKKYNPFSTLPPEGGLIGKLNVRKSGKVELDWGGTMLSLGMGADTEFLTSAIVIEQNVNLENPEASTGTAYGMGEVTRKFVLVPVWDEEEDWDPSLDDIDGLDQE
ncbi:RNA polymerase III RPC4-domain-containing protein [Hypoxylon crocopeplum]|nr:RNA polymerase III RPC4-domain-containing protein [Hypoxylon crocopeplum]